MSIRSVNIMHLIQLGEDGKISDGDLEKFMRKAEHGLSLEVLQEAKDIQSAVGISVTSKEAFKTLRDRVLDTLEKAWIEAMFKEYGRDTTAIAQASGLERSYVYRLIHKHKLGGV